MSLTPNDNRHAPPVTNDMTPPPFRGVSLSLSQGPEGDVTSRREISPSLPTSAPAIGASGVGVDQTSTLGETVGSLSNPCDSRAIVPDLSQGDNGSTNSGPMVSLDAVRSSHRDARGRFQPGNQAATTTGDRAKQLAGHPGLAGAYLQRVDAIEADLGGREELSELERSHVRELARLDVIVEGLGNDLLERGVMTAKGKTRAALTAYLSAYDRLTKGAAAIGLKRRSKPVPELTAYLAAKGTTS